MSTTTTHHDGFDAISISCHPGSPKHPSTVIYHYLFSEVQNLINIDCVCVCFMFIYLYTQSPCVAYINIFQFARNSILDFSRLFLLLLSSWCTNTQTLREREKSIICMVYALVVATIIKYGMYIIENE